MKKKQVDRKKWLVHQFRRLSLKWPPRIRVFYASRREQPRKKKKDGTPYKSPTYEYQCNMCKNWFPNKEIALDHIEPVVDPMDKKFKTEKEFLADFVDSLFCGEDNYQVLCIPCHKIKTSLENKLRKK